MEYLSNLSETQLENVKHVLFGNQRQANVINEAVTFIVAGTLSELRGKESLDSEQSVVMSINSYLQEAVDGNIVPDETFILLTAGTQSLQCLKSDGEKMASAENPDPESPKYLFRIHLVDDAEQSDISRPTQFTVRTGDRPVLPESDNKFSVGETAQQKVDRLTKELSELCPEAVMQELGGDAKSAAIFVAEAYYKNA